MALSPTGSPLNHMQTARMPYQRMEGWVTPLVAYLFHWLMKALGALPPLSLCYTCTWADHETEENPSLWIKAFE